MTVLGIETATSVCGAAVVRDGRLVAGQWRDEKYIHAELLVPLIDGTLREARLSVQQVDGIAVSIGPGSFTGLRIGLSVAKGLAYAMSRPIVGVPTLYALARRAVDAGVVHTTAIIPMLDARRDEVYCQMFGLTGSVVEARSEERAVHLSQLLEELSGEIVTVTGEGAARFAAYTGRSAQHTRQHAVIGNTDVSACSAATVALLGEEMFHAGRKDDAPSLEPRYVKDVYLKSPSHIRT